MLTLCRDELLNPHKKCVRDLLDALTCLDNEYQLANIELRNIQKQLKQSVDNVIYQCSEKRKLACASEEKLNEFQKNIENIDEVTEKFKKVIEEIEERIQKIRAESKISFENLQYEKAKLKQFHEETINHLKTFAAQSSDKEKIRNCEKDINELNKQFLKEITLIRKCESVLKPFFQLLHHCQYKMCQQCNFDEYQWMPQGKSTQIVDTIAEKIKATMGPSLRKAFAHLHIHRPYDEYSFMAQYLMSLERSEEIVKQKLYLFLAK